MSRVFTHRSRTQGESTMGASPSEAVEGVEGGTWGPTLPCINYEVTCRRPCLPKATKGKCLSMGPTNFETQMMRGKHCEEGTGLDGANSRENSSLLSQLPDLGSLKNW